MGVTGNPDEIQRYGELFSLVTKDEPVVTWNQPYGAGGPLSAGLANAQDQKARAAATFGATKDSGLLATGEGLKQIGVNLTDFDNRGANSIKGLFPEPAPGTGGGA
jgi:hypothetical protein